MTKARKTNPSKRNADNQADTQEPPAEDATNRQPGDASEVAQAGGNSYWWKNEGGSSEVQ